MEQVSRERVAELIGDLETIAATYPDPYADVLQGLRELLSLRERLEKAEQVNARLKEVLSVAREAVEILDPGAPIRYHDENWQKIADKRLAARSASGGA